MIFLEVVLDLFLKSRFSNLVKDLVTIEYD